MWVQTVTAMEDLFTVNFDLIYESPSKETDDKTFTVVPAEQTAFPRLQHICYKHWQLTLAKLANVSKLSLLATLACAEQLLKTGSRLWSQGPKFPRPNVKEFYTIKSPVYSSDYISTWH